MFCERSLAAKRAIHAGSFCHLRPACFVADSSLRVLSCQTSTVANVPGKVCFELRIPLQGRCKQQLWLIGTSVPVSCYKLSSGFSLLLHVHAEGVPEARRRCNRVVPWSEKRRRQDMAVGLYPPLCPLAGLAQFGQLLASWTCICHCAGTCPGARDNYPFALS